MALTAAVVSQLLPLAERHPEHVATWLSNRIGRPVAFDKLETHWTRRGPLLRLDGLRIGQGDKMLRIGDAEMLISQYAGLLPGHSFTELRLRGLDLILERHDDGGWAVRGLPGEQQAGGDPFAELEGLGELQVIGGRLTVLAPQLQIVARVPRVDVRLRVDGDRVRAGMRAWMQPKQSPLIAVADFGRKNGVGRAYVAARQADLAAWSPLLHLAGVVAEGGSGRAEAWARLQDHRIAGITVDTALDDLILRGTALADGTRPQLRFDHLRTRADWRAQTDGWRLDVRQLRIENGRSSWTADGLMLTGGSRMAIAAKDVDAGPLLAVAALSDRMVPALRQWIVAAKPELRGNDIRLIGAHDGRTQVSGRITGLGFDPVGGVPGMHGLAGRIQGDRAGLAVVFDSKALLRVDWPRGFGVSHSAHLTGSIAGWRAGKGWQIGTSSLHARGEDFGVALRGALRFQGDGTRPQIDLAAQLDPMRLPLAKNFWIHSAMSPATIEWLDAALIDGRLENARVLVSGDLDDWPFVAHNGRFQASAHLRDATVRFRPDWPPAEHMDGDVDFIANGFQMSGKTMLAGVEIPRFEAGIAHFDQARLAVHAQGGGDASKLLELLRRSPLHKPYGETMDNLQAGGPAAVSFDLDLPLDGKSAGALGGTVALSGARLNEKRWNLAFTDVRGRARYDQGGFVAESLAVRYQQRPGTLSLRAGSHVRDSKQAFEAELGADIAAHELLARAPQLDWLQPYLEGQSAWSIAVAIPAATVAASRTAATRPAAVLPAQLRLRSNLVGTRLRLPAPLDKDASIPLPTTVETRLPLDQGEIAVAFGGRLALRVRSTDKGMGVRVRLGSEQVTEPAPASGLIATGHATSLDAIEWASLASASDHTKDAARNDARGGLPLRMIDVSTDHLHLLGADFPAIRVRATPVSGATRVQLDGDALAGVLRLPQAPGAAISAQLQRLHWRSGTTAGKDNSPALLPNAQRNASSSRDIDIDPARVPPLELAVDDLRMGAARLGAATLRTRPTTRGLHIEQLQTRARGQRIDASGDWNSRGATTRTDLTVAVDSQDLGALLAGFGYGGQLAGGTGKIKLTAGWAGSPAAFKLDALDGTLRLDLLDGQLIEVEPGAGRVLGLLSITQLPRRLTLDFHDFFSKGFAFDRLEGDVALTRGKAHTDDLVLNGPAAKIRIHGDVDLHAQTFDQSIEVFPKTGNLLTAVGAIAGGPVGAAIGAAANAMLKKPLGQLAAKTYHVTGPWKDPKVEVIGRDQLRVPRPVPVAPPD